MLPTHEDYSFPPHHPSFPAPAPGVAQYAATASRPERPLKLHRWLGAWLAVSVVVAILSGIATAFVLDGQALGQGVFFGIIFGMLSLGPVLAAFCTVLLVRKVRKLVRQLVQPPVTRAVR